jgi:hypothetical protein
VILEPTQQGLIDGITKFFNSTAAGVPTRRPENESGVTVGNREEPDLSDITPDIVFGNRVGTVIDAVLKDMCVVVDGDQGLVEDAVENAPDANLMTSLVTDLFDRLDDIGTP